MSPSETRETALLRIVAAATQSFPVDVSIDPGTRRVRVSIDRYDDKREALEQMFEGAGVTMATRNILEDRVDYFVDPTQPNSERAIQKLAVTAHAAFALQQALEGEKFEIGLNEALTTLGVEIPKAVQVGSARPVRSQRG